MSEDALIKNVADPKQVREAKQKELQGRDLEINDLAWILNDIKGRRFIWRIFEFARMNETSFSGENHATTDFNEGMKNVGRKILADIMETRAESYIEMLNENRKGE